MTQSVSELARRECDERSVYVGNVEYAATAAELEEHFAKGMVDVNRVTIMINKYTQQPKGWARALLCRTHVLGLRIWNCPTCRVTPTHLHWTSRFSWDDS
jgi:hypothetical protein